MTRAQLRNVLVVGAYPPPMGGAAKNTEIVQRELSARATVPVVPVVTSAGGLAHTRTIGYHIRRICKNALAGLKLLRHVRAGSTAYFVPDGGYGAWYTFLHVALCRFAGARIVIHHRTFRYIDSDSLPVRALTEITRRTAKHVFLSQGMADRYIQRYGSVSYLVATNARFVTTHRDPQPIPSSDRIIAGHLSNLCRDKGFFEVIETFDALLASGIDCEIHLGGPILEPEVAEQLRRIQLAYPDRVRHVGAVTADKKADFYRALDIFLFPTQFDLEAQPNVIYEAFSFGIPVVTIERGCIAEMVPPYAGLVVARDGDFVKAAVEYVAQDSWRDPQAKNRIMSFVEVEAEQARRSYATLYSYILEQRKDG